MPGTRFLDLVNEIDPIDDSPAPPRALVVPEAITPAPAETKAPDQRFLDLVDAVDPLAPTRDDAVRARAQDAREEAEISIVAHARGLPMDVVRRNRTEVKGEEFADELVGTNKCQTIWVGDYRKGISRVSTATNTLATTPAMAPQLREVFRACAVTSSCCRWSTLFRLAVRVASWVLIEVRHE